MHLLPRKRNTLYIVKSGVLITLGIITLYSCKKDKGPGQLSANAQVNTWITDSLTRYYYWADQLKTDISKEQEPVNYFNTIKNAADRFSYVTLPGQQSSFPENTRNRYGFDYIIFNEPVTGRTLGLVTLVLNTSPAKGAGLRRGEYFTKVNGTLLTAANATELATQMLGTTNVKLATAFIEGTVVKESGTATIQAAPTLEQTAVQTTLHVGGKNIGYLFFTAFNAAERNDYLTVFDSFKADNISELILDLRYNAGGDVSAAAAMCSMLAPAINSGSIFIEYKGNKNSGARKESFATAASAANGPSFQVLQQHKLTLPRLYVLTTAATASAAELVINNLRPYIQIIQIGETTRGKDEASIVISDKRSPKQINWVIYPIVYKVFNAEGNGGYSAGLAPAHVMIESANLPLQAFGNEADPMINYTLNLITGGDEVAVLKQNSNTIPKQLIIVNSATQGSNLPLITF